MSFPIFLKYMLDWVKEEDAELKEGYMIAGGISIALLFRSYAGLLSDYIIELVNAKVRNCIRVGDFFDFL